jgi:methylenetetrahydrofolate--tRNA-(uracil-5-)-methyltransferase
MAGQVTGTEGYVEAAASGLLAALNVWAHLSDSDPVVLPTDTALGSLIAYATDPATSPYQPMHVNFGIIPPLPERVKGKRERYAAYSQRAQESLTVWLSGRPDLVADESFDG